MDLLGSEHSEARFWAYVGELIEVIGHADRAGPLRDYCLGLLMPSGRKSVEPLAAVTAPARVAAQHQSLLHFVGNAPWSDEKLLAKVRTMVLPAVERSGPVEAWIIDDTGFPKKGRHSVGVTRQYCGQLGKQDNCQVAVTLSIASRQASLPVAYRLYLPEDWAKDAERRRKAGVPAALGFQTKPAIALEQVRAACAAGVPRGVVLMDAGYGSDTRLRTSLTALGLSYIAGIQPGTSVWAPGTAPLAAKAWSGRGRPPTRLRRDEEHRPVAVKPLALGLSEDAWQTVTWREGSADWLSSRFARLRVRAAHRDDQHAEIRAEEWLLIEWPEGESEPTKYWLASVADDTAFDRLVDLAKLRWRIERDYQELKQELGLGHYEGRGWRGFHHHASLCIAAYGFLIAERETIPPSGSRAAPQRPALGIPEDYRPRGAAHPTRAPHSKLDRHHAAAADRRPRTKPRAMSMLCRAESPTATLRAISDAVRLGICMKTKFHLLSGPSRAVGDGVGACSSIVGRLHGAAGGGASSPQPRPAHQSHRRRAATQP
jgi:SRSO17 transposase